MVGSHGSPWGYELLRVVLILVYPSLPLNSEAPQQAWGKNFIFPRGYCGITEAYHSGKAKAPFLEQVFLPPHQALYLQP